MHRKRSQVAVVTGDGQVQLNRNVVNGSEPMLRLIGGLPAGTPVAFEAAYGRGWLVELLEDYGFEPHLVHPCDARRSPQRGRRTAARVRLGRGALVEISAPFGGGPSRASVAPLRLALVEERAHSLSRVR